MSANVPYIEILIFLETGKVSLLEMFNYKVLVPNELNSWRMRPVTWVFDSGTVPNSV